MEKGTIIVSMTTWPPRAATAFDAMRAVVRQNCSQPVHYVLALSDEEFTADHPIVADMQSLGVEVIFDRGNTRPHKKLMPAIERYPDNAIIVIDDDIEQRDGWLQQMIDDHEANPDDIIYGLSGSVVEMQGDRIVEGFDQRGLHTHPGRVTLNCKPANGAAGTLYPAGTFTDRRFFDRELYMTLSPTSDETWQWAFAVMAGRTFRCLSAYNYPYILPSDQTCALARINVPHYTDIHNRIADAFPEYRRAMKNIIKQL